MTHRPVFLSDFWSALKPSTGSIVRLWPQLLLTLLTLPVLVGCEKTPRNIFDTESANAQISADLYMYIFWITMVIMVIVSAVFVIAIVRFREKPGDDGSHPKQVHGHLGAEIGWTVVPAIITVAIMIPTVQKIEEIETAPPMEEALHVEVIGKQWWWEYDYLEFKGLKKVNRPHYGVKPEDKGKEGTFDVVEEPIFEHAFAAANELHVEVGRPVTMQITSADVIHAFWVPRLFGKRDATPGRVYPIHFTPETPGEYIGQCAELCGASHALMGIKVFVHPKEGPDSFTNWYEAQKKVAEPPTAPEAVKGKELFLNKGCIACHNIYGDSRTTMDPLSRSRTTGPDLTHVGSRTTILSNTRANTLENLTEWIYDPASIKEGAIMADPRYNQTKVTEDEARAMASYLIRLK